MALRLNLFFFPCQSKRAPTRPYSTFRHSCGCHASPTDTITPQFSKELVQVGIIGGTHGVDGEVRVQPTTDFENNTVDVTRWIRIQPGRIYKAKDVVVREIESEGGWPHVHKGHNLWVLKFKGFESCVEAGVLNGCQLMVHPDERNELPEDEFYIQELVGIPVFLKKDGSMLGHVDDVMLGGDAADILMVHVPDRPKSKPVLVPFVQEIVSRVDIKKKEIIITPPDGLIDLAIIEHKAKDGNHVIRKFVQAGAHLRFVESAEGALRREYLQDIEALMRSRYETLHAIRECFRRRQQFCIVEEDKREHVLSKRVANIILAYKTIKVLP